MLAAHDVNHTIRVVEHRSLIRQITLAVTQVRVNKTINLALHTLKPHTVADIYGTLLARGVGSQRDVLTRVALCAHVSNVVTHRPQGPLIRHNSGTADTQ